MEFNNYSHDTDRIYDYVVVGTGVTAAYVGYKLKKHFEQVGEPYPRVLFLSKDNYVGGRIVSNAILDSPFFAEMCALRYFPKTQPRIRQVVEELNVPTVPFDNRSYLVVTPTYPEISQTLLKKYPIESSIAYETPIAIALNNIAGPSGIEKQIQSTGLSQFRAATNVNFFNTFSKIIEFPVERRFAMGFQSFVKTLYNQWKDVFETKLEYWIQSIDCVSTYNIPLLSNTSVTSMSDTHVRKSNSNHNNVHYSINNGDYFARKVIFTGTFTQFNYFNTNSDNIRGRRALLNEYFERSPAMRIYLYFDKPWWGNLYYEFRTTGPIGRLFYYTSNVIQIYNLGPYGTYYGQLLKYQGNRVCESGFIPCDDHATTENHSRLSTKNTSHTSQKTKRMFKSNFSSSLLSSSPSPSSSTLTCLENKDTVLPLSSTASIAFDPWIDTQPNDIRHFTWRPPFYYPELVCQVQKDMMALFDEAKAYQAHKHATGCDAVCIPIPTACQINSLSKIAIKYTPQAIGAPRNIDRGLLTEATDKIAVGDEFFYVSGDLNVREIAWVNTCFENVDRYWDAIVHESSN